MIDYSGLSPEDLFFTQREAYLNGDLAAVKEMAEIARTRLNKPHKEDWYEAKNELANMKFPDDIDFREIHAGEYHEVKNNKHELLSYKNSTPLNIKNFELEARYNFCKKCDEVRNKQLCLFNGNENKMCEKWFIRNGEEVKGKNIQEIAEDMFMV